MPLSAKLAALSVASVVAAASAVSYAQTPSAGAAQAWPTKPIRMLVGFPAGGPTDVVARLVSDKLAQQIGGRIVVDNRPGAAGNIAVELLAEIEPRRTYAAVFLERDRALAGALHETRLRPAQGYRTGHRSRRGLPDFPRASFAAGEKRAGIHRLRESAPGPAQLCLLGNGHEHASRFGAVLAAHGHTDAARAVQRNRAVARRPDRRQGSVPDGRRVHGRAPREGRASCARLA